MNRGRWLIAAMAMLHLTAAATTTAQGRLDMNRQIPGRIDQPASLIVLPFESAPPPTLSFVSRWLEDLA
jgi:hypothetical protein